MLNSQRMIIIYKLDPNKARGHVMNTICMLKMCSYAIIEPHFKIFKTCLNLEYFHMTGERETL